MLQKILYKKHYVSAVSTRVSNALLVGGILQPCLPKTGPADNSVEVLGQVVVGLVCDRVGRKSAMVGTTLMIVLGGILSTASTVPGALSNLLNWSSVLMAMPGKDPRFWML